MQRWDDGSGRITVVRSKTDTEAQGTVVAITPAAMKALDAIRSVGAGGEVKVFGLSESQIARRVKAIARAAGSRAAAWSAATPAASPPGRRCGIYDVPSELF